MRKETEEKMKRLMEDSVKCKSLEELTALFTTLGFTEAQGQELLKTNQISSLPFLHSNSETETSTQAANPTAARLKLKLLKKQKEALATASVTIAPALAPTQTDTPTATRKLKGKKKVGGETSMEDAELIQKALTTAAQITVPPPSAEDHPTQATLAKKKLKGKNQQVGAETSMMEDTELIQKAPVTVATAGPTQTDTPTATRKLKGKKKVGAETSMEDAELIQKALTTAAQITVPPPSADDHPTQATLAKKKLKEKNQQVGAETLMEDTELIHKALATAAQIVVPPPSGADPPTQGNEQAEAETEADTKTSFLKAIESTLDMEEAVRLSQDFLAFRLGKFQREAGTEKVEELHDEKQPHELDRSDDSGNDGEHEPTE